MESLRTRTWVAVLAIAAAFAFVAPNFINTSNIKWWPAGKLNYGLDIQGGLHLVMGVDVGGVLATSVLRQTQALQAEFAKENIVIKDFDLARSKDGQFVIHTSTADDAKKVDAFLQKNHSTTLQVVATNADNVEVKYFDAYLLDQKQNVIRQAIETIRNRIDEFGVSEPSITQQGADRILVQLPGMADADKAKQLINTTAKLDFMLVSYEKSAEELKAMIAEAEKAGGYTMETLKYSEYVARLNQDLASKLPPQTTIFFQKLENAKSMEIGATPYLLRTDTDLTGEHLDNAAVAFDQFGAPEVSLKFNSLGATKFSDLTAANVNKQVAVVLDRVVKTAPSINGRIPNGEARITLGRSNAQDTLEEAKLIATALRAGALPASLEQLEERRVGPTLGLDALNKAKLGSYVGAIIVLIFMAIYYRTMGVISSISMMINILSMFALLGSLGATLTLPGIAGMALTVGFAVDANVLINERMREELAKGASLRSAAKEGYNKAMSAIIDSNITVSSTALVLLYFGTGPVRGFAVTLLVGIATTLFANVFVSKVIVDNLVHRIGVKKLSV